MTWLRKLWARWVNRWKTNHCKRHTFWHKIWDQCTVENHGKYLLTRHCPGYKNEGFNGFDCPLRDHGKMQKS